MWLMDRPPANKSPEYKAWYQMNKVWTGLVCDNWRWRKHCYTENKKAFSRFRKFVGPRPDGKVLIRLDNTQPFQEGNVRWGTMAECNTRRNPFKKYSYSRDEELIAELESRGYKVT